MKDAEIVDMMLMVWRAALRACITLRQVATLRRRCVAAEIHRLRAQKIHHDVLNFFMDFAGKVF